MSIGVSPESLIISSALGGSNSSTTFSVDWLDMVVFVANSDNRVASSESGLFSIKNASANALGSLGAWLKSGWVLSIFVVFSHSSGPLVIGLGFEVAPESLLSIRHTGGAIGWASADWLSGGESHLQESVVPAGFEEKDDDHDVEDTKTDKAETEHLSTSESSDETLVDGAAAGEGNSGVGVDSDSHTNVTGKDGGH